MENSNANFIKDYWENQAKVHKQSHEASWGDSRIIDLEIMTIGQYIPNGSSVLDAGCGNGYSTFRQCQAHSLASMTGIDFSENMIKEARSALPNYKIQNEIRFSIGDIRSLKFDNNTFDIVYTTRSIINLPSWSEQLQAISECIRVAKKGGKIIISEAFWEPLTLLNALRALKQLPALVEHDFNRYIKKAQLESYLISNRINFEVNDFSSIYYLGSRFLRELVTDAAAYPGFTNPINKLFFEIEQQYSGGGFGIQQAYVLTKPLG